MDLEYTIKKSSKRRKLTISIERDRKVIVHAPEGTSAEKIEKVVESKRQWIFEKIQHAQKYKKRPHAPGKELVSGESALYLGRSYQIEMVKIGLERVDFKNKFLIPQKHAVEGTEVLRDWYIAKAKEKIIPRVKIIARDLGVNFSSAKIVDNRYRWGSCTPKNNVNLNWRLIKAPMFVIDYVIVHELAHFIEPNHNDRFWNIVRTHNTNAEKAKEWLKLNGQVLEEVV
jgi:hypothetical protein